MTSTATLQAALDVMKNSDPSIGYSIAYPFGVIGPILCIYFMTRQVQPKFPPKAQRFHMGEITLAARLPRAARSSRSDRANLPEGVQVTMVRIKAAQRRAEPDDLVLAAGDALLIVADAEDGLSQAAAKLGKLEPGRIVKDRSALDYIRVFVGKASMVGVPLSQLRAADRLPCSCCMSAATTRTSCRARPDAGIRRSRRRAGAARSQGGSAQASSATP